MRKLALIVTALLIAASAIAFSSKPVAASGCPSGGEYGYTLASHVTVAGGAWLYAETILLLPCSGARVGTFQAAEAIWLNNGGLINNGSSQLTAEAVMGTIVSNPSGPATQLVGSGGIEYYYLYSSWIPSYTANHSGCTNTYGPWASNPNGFAYVSGDGTKYTLPYSYMELNYINCLTWNGSNPGIAYEGH